MGSTNNQARFGVLWKGEVYDLLSVYTGKDETVYVTTYDKHGKVGNTRLPTRGERSMGATVDLTKIKTYVFEQNKVSFHPSGYIHMTDKKGGRLHQFDTQIGIAFNKIIDCCTLFSYYPTTPEEYRKHIFKKDNDIQIVDVEQYGFVPWQLTCYLSKSDYNFGPTADELNNKYKSIFLRLRRYLPSHNLDLIIRVHKSSSDIFPSSSTMCYFLGFDYVD